MKNSIPQQIRDRIDSLPDPPEKEEDWEEARKICKECPQAWEYLPEIYHNKGLGPIDIGGGYW